MSYTAGVAAILGSAPSATCVHGAIVSYSPRETSYDTNMKQIESSTARWRFCWRLCGRWAFRSPRSAESGIGSGSCVVVGERCARRGVWAFAVQAAFAASHMSSTGNPIYHSGRAFGEQELQQDLQREMQSREIIFLPFVFAFPCKPRWRTTSSSISDSTSGRHGSHRGERTTPVAKTASLGRPSRRWATTTCGLCSPASADAPATSRAATPGVGFRALQHAA